MRLPPFDYMAPESLEQAVKIKRDMGTSALVLAGGTDLIPNLKNRLFAPAALISLKNIEQLKNIDSKQDSLVIGAAASLASIAAHPTVNEHFPILVKAVQSIGAMGIQWFRGTLGGNVCCQPRCLFYNQSLFWRIGKGSCHRTGGKECHALEGSESCQSICSGDTVPVLLALSAQVGLASTNGRRLAPLSEFYTGKGESPFNIMPEEILTEIRIPLPWTPIGWSYQRIAAREAVDFPLANAAAVSMIDKGRIDYFRLVLSAIGPAPIMVKEVQNLIKGSEPNLELPARSEEMALRAAEGVVVGNASASKEYRLAVAGVMARRAVQEALQL